MSRGSADGEPARPTDGRVGASRESVATYRPDGKTDAQFSRGHHAEGLHRHHTGDICPTCRRSKTLPIIDITGLLPLIEHLTDTPTDTPIPFRLRSIS
ncbi:MAG: hypothetical protein ACKVWR_01830 [Acidimicrobiales bacterium]